VTYLDVGQGDAAVIEGYGKTIVIDAGRTGKELEGYLRYLGKRTIDALVITHADDDHAAGATYLIKKLTVKEVWDNGMVTYPDSLLKNTVHRSLVRGDEVSTGKLAVLVLHPYAGFYTFADNEALEENNGSLVVKVTGRQYYWQFEYPNGVITIPAAACSGSVHQMKSFLGGLQAFCGGPFSCTVEAANPGKYQLTARVVAVHDEAHLPLAPNNARNPIDVVIPYTCGQWQVTKPVEITLVQGKNVLSFSKPTSNFTVKDLLLTPVK